jgi:5-methylcytosine-specific restriction endonuclease McrA
MNLLPSLKNPDLLDSMFRLAGEERRITLSVLQHFREIERRKAYSDLNYKSLFEYAVTHLRYSEGSASRRIAAMHALKEHPELGKRIESGETTVSSVARIHTTIRRDEKMSEEKWRPEEKKEAFAELGALPMKELERKLVELVPEAALSEKLRPVTPDLHELKIHLSAEELAALEELRGALSHSLKNPGSYSELFGKLIQIGKERLEKSRKNPLIARRDASPLTGENDAPSLPSESDASPLDASPLDASPLDASPLVEKKEIRKKSDPIPHSSSLSAHDKRLVFARANHRCEHIDSAGKRCDSRFFLQIEHRIPRAKGGSDEMSNLEILCRDHNLIRGIQVFGAERMRRK